jgi:hypothetical protein
MWRFREKNGIEDLRKCKQYLCFLIESIRRGEENG